MNIPANIVFGVKAIGKHQVRKRRIWPIWATDFASILYNMAQNKNNIGYVSCIGLHKGQKANGADHVFFSKFFENFIRKKIGWILFITSQCISLLVYGYSIKVSFDSLDLKTDRSKIPKRATKMTFRFSKSLFSETTGWIHSTDFPIAESSLDHNSVSRTVGFAVGIRTLIGRNSRYFHSSSLSSMLEHTLLPNYRHNFF